VSFVACTFYFFFQAEDGIRDFHVTGVQTCALPISVGKYLNGMLVLAILNALFTFIVLSAAGVRYAGLLAALALPITFIPLVGSRSEERRVGKECNLLRLTLLFN